MANVSVGRITGRGGSPDQYLVDYDASQTQEILDLPFLTSVVDTFDVIVTDQFGDSDRATVTVNLLAGTFHAPIAVDDEYPLDGGPPIIAG